MFKENVYNVGKYAYSLSFQECNEKININLNNLLTQQWHICVSKQLMIYTFRKHS